MTRAVPVPDHFHVRCKLVLSALALVQAGCSFIFVEGPPARHRELPYFACTTTYATPVVDTVVGGLSAVSAATDGKAKDSARATMLVTAVTLAASAVYGYTQVGRCEAASTELAARMYVPPPTPQASPVPAPPVPEPALPVAPPQPAPPESTRPAPAWVQPVAPQP